VLGFGLASPSDIVFAGAGAKCPWPPFEAAVDPRRRHSVSEDSIGGNSLISIAPDGAGTPNGLSMRSDSCFGVQSAEKLGELRSRARLRQARVSDALDLACLIDCASRGLALWLWSTLRGAGQSSIEVGRHRIRTLTASPLHYAAFTVAEIDGAVAGALTGRLIPLRYERGDSADLPEVYAPLLELEAVAAGSWYLNVVAVYPEFRGQGLGSALLRKAEEIARLADAPQISLIVEEANAGALKLYLQTGFRESKRRPFIPFPGSADRGDWILLRKDIAR
jgi:ribosomal protein S18 acetylase RimI-like enzyme